MPGKLPTYSDRGSIKDIAHKGTDKEKVPEEPYTPMEIRMKKLYDIATITHNEGMKAALGFITVDYIGDKAANPLSFYRLKEIVNDISSKQGSKINEIRKELETCFTDAIEEKEYYKNLVSERKDEIRKTAGLVINKPGVFRRVSVI